MFDPHAVLDHYQKPVPRYTSYPTAPQFKDGMGPQIFADGLGMLKPEQTVSAYLHIPFCDRLCWFCGCHTKHTLKYKPISAYLKYLTKEIELVGQQLSFRPKLGQLHLGGGSPSLLKRDDLQMLRAALDDAFEIDTATEISVEIDPNDMKNGSAEALIRFGLTRASIGVQDFHPDVQTAINRPQSFETTRDVVQELRQLGIKSINIDALYGLPLQTGERLMQTIARCIELKPDRMALFGYAHVPWLKKHQNLIRTEDLPNTLDRYAHAQAASAALVEAGYKAIGIDHFALPGDSLAIAAQAGQLHRNFQGYTTDNHPTLIGFGASSIGRFDHGYVQNTIPTALYQQQVANGILPKKKGLVLLVKDRLAGHIIERLMCDFEIDFSTLSSYPEWMVAKCREKAVRLIEEDPFALAKMEGDRLKISHHARPFARIVAAHFDDYYAPENFQYSKAV